MEVYCATVTSNTSFDKIQKNEKQHTHIQTLIKIHDKQQSIENNNYTHTHTNRFVYVDVFAVEF